jgi:hypothetical protein
LTQSLPRRLNAGDPMPFFVRWYSGQACIGELSCKRALKMCSESARSARFGFVYRLDALQPSAFASSAVA